MNKEVPARVPWNGNLIPFPWALLGLVKRQNEMAGPNDDFCGQRLDGVREAVLEILRMFLDQGGQLLDTQTQHDLESTDPRQLLPDTMAEGAEIYLNPIDRWEKIQQIPKHANPPSATPYVNLLLLNDATVTRAWMDEAMAFEERQHPGRGKTMLLDLTRGLIRLGEGPGWRGWEVAVEKIEHLYGKDWPICNLGAGGSEGSLAGELGKSWDIQRNGWLMDRFSQASDRCRQAWPKFSLGNFLLRHNHQLLMFHMGAEQDHWASYVHRLRRAMSEHTSHEIARGQWTRSRFGGLHVAEEDYETLSSWVKGLFRQTGDPERIIDLLEVFEQTCGLDVSGPHVSQISDDDQRLLPIGWEQTNLAAAWKRRKLAQVAGPALTGGAPTGAPKTKM